MKKIDRFQRGMGIGGWLTNYKRFNVLPDNMRMDITIGDMEHFREYITKDDVKNIAELGFDHIRLGFDQIVVEESPYKYRQEIVDIIRRFSDWCDEYNLRFVLNMHKAIGNYCDIPNQKGLWDDIDVQNRFIAVWSMFEDVFSDKESVFFELLNEAICDDAELWNDLAERTIKAIREKNKDRYIVIGGTCWSVPEALNYQRVFDDDKVIYTFHFYMPNEFTHQQGVLQWPNLHYNRKLPYPCDDIEIYKEYYRCNNFNVPDWDVDKIDIVLLRECFSPVINFMKKNPDKILWCGEFGTIRHIKIDYRENWMRDVITILKENDIPYSVWNYLSTPNDGNRFSLVDDDTRKVLSENLKNILLGDF